MRRPVQRQCAVHTAAGRIISRGLQPGPDPPIPCWQKGACGLLLATAEHLSYALLVRALAPPSHCFPSGDVISDQRGNPSAWPTHPLEGGRWLGDDRRLATFCQPLINVCQPHNKGLAAKCI